MRVSLAREWCWLWRLRHEHRADAGVVEGFAGGGSERGID